MALHMSEHAALTIGSVARQAGIATSTIRYYEEIGLLPQPARVNATHGAGAVTPFSLTMTGLPSVGPPANCFRCDLNPDPGPRATVGRPPFYPVRL